MVAGKVMQAKTDITIIHKVFDAPKDGMMAIGKIRATTMPLIMIEETLLKTASTPR